MKQWGQQTDFGFSIPVFRGPHFLKQQETLYTAEIPWLLKVCDFGWDHCWEEKEETGSLLHHKDSKETLLKYKASHSQL